jgi:hypothetical protein
VPPGCMKGWRTLSALVAQLSTIRPSSPIRLPILNLNPI